MRGATAHEARVVAEAAAQAGGAVIRAALERREVAAVTHKSAIDLVTEVDLAAEAAICEELQRRSPGVPVLAEERGGARGGATRWIVDPLDGTTNFVHGFPAFCVSVGLEVDGELLAGAIYEPLLDRLTSAAAGLGARQGGHPLRVSGCAALSGALTLTGFAYDRRERADFYLHFVKHFLERSQGVRRAGSAALDLCHIAAGRADAYWEFNLQPWDVAAGALIVREAGGVVTAADGGPLRLDAPQVLASNGLLHDEMVGALRLLLESAPGGGGWSLAGLGGQGGDAEARRGR
jgi:myo-inositol-1(or 4)-monophosphatase